MWADLVISGVDPKRLERRTTATYCQPHTPLSLARCAAAPGARLMLSLEVIISQHVSHARLISACCQIVQGSSLLRSFPLFHNRREKTIDECTLNVTSVPPGSEGDLRSWWSISTWSEMYRCVVSPTDYNTPWGSRQTKGLRCQSALLTFMLYRECCFIFLP